MQEEGGHHRAPRADQAVGDPTGAGGDRGAVAVPLGDGLGLVLGLVFDRRGRGHRQRSAEPHEDAEGDQEQQCRQDRTDLIGGHVGQHRHPDQRSDHAGEGQAQHQSAVDVAETPMGEGRGQAGDDLGQVHRGGGGGG